MGGTCVRRTGCPFCRASCRAPLRACATTTEAQLKKDSNCLFGYTPRRRRRAQCERQQSPPVVPPFPSILLSILLCLLLLLGHPTPTSASCPSTPCLPTTEYCDPSGGGTCRACSSAACPASTFLTASCAGSSDYECSGVDALTGPTTVLTVKADGATGVAFLDVDGDGLLDVAAVSQHDNKLQWFRNLGDGTWAGQLVLATANAGPTALAVSDVDEDGDDDLLVVSAGDNELAWYANLGGGTFSSQRIISSAVLSPSAVRAADLNSDGHDDVLTASTDDGKLAWFASKGLGVVSAGTPVFQSEAVISTRPGAHLGDAVTGDLNGDGTIDVVASYRSDDAVHWFANDGGGQFEGPFAVTEALDGALALAVADLNDDGFLDLLVGAEYANKVVWFANNGTGGFPGGASTVSSVAVAAHWVGAVDLDLDDAASLDVVFAAQLGHKVAWQSQDGAGGFSGVDSTLYENTFGGPRHGAFADWDGDGDVDVGIAMEYDDAVVLVRNDACVSCPAGTFAPSGCLRQDDSPADGCLACGSAANTTCTPGTEFLAGCGGVHPGVCTPCGSPATCPPGSYETVSCSSDSNHECALCCGDGEWGDGCGGVSPGTCRSCLAEAISRCTDAEYLDGCDGSATGGTCQACASEPPCDLSEFPVASCGGPSSQPTRCAATVDMITQVFVVSATEVGASTVEAMDVDGDGDGDLVVIAAGVPSVGWYRNDGADDGFSFRRAIGTLPEGPAALHGADLNADGAVDVVVALAAANTIMWFANDQAGYTTAVPQRVISDTLAGVAAVTAADLTGDGLLDVVAAETGAAGVRWFENLGGNQFSVTQTIDSTLGNPVFVLAPDLDSDGLPDVIVAARQSDSVVWYRNLGQNGTAAATFTIPIPITTSAAGVRSVLAGDVDGDGDLDVLVAAGAAGAILLFMNTDGAGTLTTSPVVVTTSADDVRSLFLSDLDQDGDLDLLSASFLDHRLAWYPNVNAGVFGSQIVFSTDARGVLWVSASDLDGDGDDDVLAASSADNAVRWFLNDACASQCPAGQFALTGCVRQGDDPALVCSTCDVAAQCDPATQFLAGCGGTSSGECTLCSTAASCPAGTYQQTPCSATADRVCAPCCGAGEWATGCGGVSQGTCKSCGVEAAERCAASEFLVGCRGGTTGGVCTPCAASGCPVDTFPVATCGSRSNSDWQCEAVANLWDVPLVLYASLDTQPGPVRAATDGVRHLLAVDLDKDGDQDVVMATAYSTVVWLENDGTGTFVAEHTVSVIHDDVRWVAVGDLNGDATLDVVGASVVDNAVIWYPNTDGAGTFSSAFVLTAALSGATVVAVADMDGDGANDVVAAGEGDGGRLVWFRNTGAGATGFTSPLGVATPAGVQALTLADMNGDASVDVLVAAFLDDSVLYYPNDGTGAFGPAVVLSASTPGPWSVVMVDMDGDALLDVVVGANSGSSDTIEIFTNQGGGTFSAPTYLAFQTDVETAPLPARGIRSVVAVDIDVDGDVDVVAVYAVTQSVVWFANDGAGGYPDHPTAILSGVDDVWVAIATDADGDLDPELLVGTRDVAAGGGTTSHTLVLLRNFACAPCPGLSQPLGQCRRLTDEPAEVCATCDPASECGASEWLVQCADDSSATCLPCSTPESCPDGTFQTGGCSDTADRVCGACCPPGQWGNGCAGLNAGTCTPCDASVCAPGFFLGGCSGTTAPGSCQPCSDPCPAGYVATTTCEGESDWVCEPAAAVLNPDSAERVSVTSVADGIAQSRPADMNNDGALDVVAGLTTAGVIQWYRNTGGGGGGGGPLSFDAPVVVTSDAAQVNVVRVTDLDGDGNQDVLYSAVGSYVEASTTELSLRLGGGAHAAIGRVEMLYQGVWGTVCKDRFGETEALIVCHQLGLGGGAVVLDAAPPGIGPIVLDEVQCTGQEPNLAACSHDGFLVHNCVHAEDVMVECTPAALVPLLAWKRGVGDGTFTPEPVITNDALGVRDVATGPLTASGFTDIAVASCDDNTVSWFQNIGGGSFAKLEVVTTSLACPSVVEIADVDGDGDGDVVAGAAMGDTKLVWVPNTDGHGAFGAAVVLSPPTPDGVPVAIAAAALHGPVGHTRTDLVVAFRGALGVPADDQLVLYRASGAATDLSPVPVPVTSSAVGLSSLVLADIDTDGLVDIVLSSDRDNSVRWYRNNAGDTVDNVATFVTEVLITKFVLNAKLVAAGDVDADGDVDVLVTSTTQDSADWFLNTACESKCPAGQRALSGCVRAGDAVSDVCVACDASACVPSTQYLAGCGGGDVGDCAACSLPGSCPEGWYESTPCGGLSDRVCSPCCADGFFSPACVGNRTDFDPLSCQVCDVGRCDVREHLDGCGGADNGTCVQCGGITTACSSSSYVVSTCGGANGADWDCETVSVMVDAAAVVGNPYPGVHAVHLVHLTADSHVDMVAASSWTGDAKWFRGDAVGGGFGSGTPIPATPPLGTVTAFADADVTEDGAADLLVAGDAVTWFQNDGAGGLSAWVELDRRAEPGDAYVGVYAKDVDADGDVDVVIATAGGGASGGVVWRENIGLGRYGPVRRIVSQPNILATAVFDANNDTLLDVVTVVSGSVHLFLNGGLTGFDPTPIVVVADAADPVLATVSRCAAADLDDDGLFDVILGSATENTVVWVGNDGAGAFDPTLNPVTQFAAGVSAILPVDLDVDGRMDLAVASFDDDTVAYYRNIGGGVFLSRVVLSADVDGANHLSAFDVDGDGDEELVAAALWAGEVLSFHNTACAGVCPDDDGVALLDACIRTDDTVAGVCTARNCSGELAFADCRFPIPPNDTALDPNATIEVNITFCGNTTLRSDVPRDVAANCTNDTVSYPPEVFIPPDQFFAGCGAEQSGECVDCTPPEDACPVGECPTTVCVRDADVQCAPCCTDELSWLDVTTDDTRLALLDIAEVGVVNLTLLSCNACNFTQCPFGEFLEDCGGLQPGACANCSVSCDAVTEVVSRTCTRDVDWHCSGVADLVDEKSLRAVSVGGAPDGKAVVAGDVDGDGRLDLVVALAEAGEVVLFRGVPGPDVFAPSELIQDGLPGAAALMLGNVDMDPNDWVDIVVLSESTGGVVVLPNNGSAGFSAPVSVGTVPGASAALTMFVDGDRGLDLVVGGSQSILWFRARGGYGSPGGWRGFHADPDDVAFGTVRGVRQMALLDVDADGWLDVVSVSSADNKFAWIRNQFAEQNDTLGILPFGEPAIISTLVRHPVGMVLADLNGDGREDAVTVSKDDGKVAVYERVGTGFGFQRVLQPPSALRLGSVAPVVQPSWVSVTDVDMNGRPDIVVAVESTSEVVWYPGVGNGTFLDPIPLTQAASGVVAAVVADVDGDEDVDVVVVSPGDTSVSWLQNQLCVASCPATTFALDLCVRPGDVDVGHADAVCHNCSVAVCDADEFLDGCGGREYGLCTPCTTPNTCPWGEFQTDGCSDFADVQCTDCPVHLCGSTQYLANCTGSSPGNCTDCDPSACTASEFYGDCVGELSPGECQPCTTAPCNDDSFELAPCSTFEDQICVTCNASVCATDQYLVGCGGLDAGNCTDCDASVCDLSTQYLGGCQDFSPGVCTDCSSSGTCPGGQYEVQSCADLQDRVCDYCCSPGFWGDGCGGDTPGVCRECDLGVCSDDEYLSDCSQGSNPGTCELCDVSACVPGTDFLKGCGTFLPGACARCSLPCGEGRRRLTYFQTACAGRHDYVCESSFLMIDGLGTVVTADLAAAAVVVTGDVNGDGWVDVVACAGEDAADTAANAAVWAPNTGAGSFGTPVAVLGLGLPGGGGYRPTAVVLADVDADGDLDLVSAVGDRGYVSWHENGDGLGGWVRERGLLQNLPNITALHAADVNLDGRVDLLVATVEAIVWYPNLGAGRFATASVLDDGVTGRVALSVADLNGDGVLDVLAAVADADAVYWYAGTGDPAGRISQVWWFAPRAVVASGAAVAGASAVVAGDVDGDGDADVFVGAAGASSVLWVENEDGGGTFAAAPTLISTATEGVRSLWATDLDVDGDLDLLSASSVDSRLAWYPNVFSGVLTSQAVFTVDAAGAQWVAAADVDGDGDDDVLAASGGDDSVRWFLNDACASQCPAGQYALTGCVRQGDDPTLVCTACDAAAQCDLATEYLSGCGGTTAGQCVSCSSTAAPCPAGSYEVTPCTATTDRVCAPCCGDLQSTAAPGTCSGPGTVGLPDSTCFACNTTLCGTDTFVHGCGPSTADPTSPGECVPCGDHPCRYGLDDSTFPLQTCVAGRDWVCDEVDNLFGNDPLREVYRSGPTSLSVVVFDANRDGHLDIVQAAPSIQSVLLHVNADGVGGAWTTSVISSVANGVNEVIAADINNDGLMDVAAAQIDTNSIVWWPSDGTGGFGPQFIIDQFVRRPISLDAADFDGDGRLDVVGVLFSDDEVWWHRNERNGTEWGHTMLSMFTREPVSVKAPDLNADGDPDIVVSFRQDNEVAVFWNLGGGVFTERSSLTTSLASPGKLIATDVDQDGNVDVVVAALTAVWWFRQRAPGSFASPAVLFADQKASALTTADLDLDGVLDLVVADSSTASVQWYRGRESGGYVPASSVLRGAVLQGAAVAVGDLDGDGDGDVVLGSSRGGGGGGTTWFENDVCGGAQCAPGFFPIDVCVRRLDVDRLADVCQPVPPSPTPSATASATQTPSPSPTVTSTPSVTPSPTATGSATPTATPTQTPSHSVTPSITPSTFHPGAATFLRSISFLNVIHDHVAYDPDLLEDVRDAFNRDMTAFLRIKRRELEVYGQRDQPNKALIIDYRLVLEPHIDAHTVLVEHDDGVGNATMEFPHMEALLGRFQHHHTLANATLGLGPYAPADIPEGRPWYLKWGFYHWADKGMEWLVLLGVTATAVCMLSILSTVAALNAWFNCCRRKCCRPKDATYATGNNILELTAQEKLTRMFAVRAARKMKGNLTQITPKPYTPPEEDEEEWEEVEEAEAEEGAGEALLGGELTPRTAALRVVPAALVETKEAPEGGEGEEAKDADGAEKGDKKKKKHKHKKSGKGKKSKKSKSKKSKKSKKSSKGDADEGDGDDGGGDGGGSSEGEEE